MLRARCPRRSEQGRARGHRGQRGKRDHGARGGPGLGEGESQAALRRLLAGGEAAGEDARAAGCGAEVSTQRPRGVPAATTLRGLTDDAFSARHDTVARLAYAAQKSGHGGTVLTRHARRGTLPKLLPSLGIWKPRTPSGSLCLVTRLAHGLLSSHPPKRPLRGSAASSSMGRGRSGTNRKSLVSDRLCESSFS